MKCLNTNSTEYQNLKQASGIPIKTLNIKCAYFQEEHGRLPRLDELQGSNSTIYLKEQLKINKNDTADKNKLLEFTGTNSVNEAIININNKYPDQQFNAIDLGDKVMVDIKQRPDVVYKQLEKIYTPDENISPLTIIEGLDELRTLYGYDIREVDSVDLEQEEWSHLMPSEKRVNAFIYDGNIYINSDNMGSDSKIHEMLHLLFGHTRFSNPELYQSLLQLTSQIENLENILQAKYPNKTMNDALEEFTVSELAKYLAGMESKLDGLSKEQIYEINYNVKRTLDTLLSGDYSTKIIPDEILYNGTYKQVAKAVNSSRLTNNFQGTSMFDGSELHRKLSNTKSELLRKGQLTEICE